MEELKRVNLINSVVGMFVVSLMAMPFRKYDSAMIPWMLSFMMIIRSVVGMVQPLLLKVELKKIYLVFVWTQAIRSLILISFGIFQYDIKIFVIVAFAFSVVEMTAWESFANGLMDIIDDIREYKAKKSTYCRIGVLVGFAISGMLSEHLWVSILIGGLIEFVSIPYKFKLLKHL